jgi:diguanylate cyclase (GGDEF)-like protein/PAS domain S-box-containing protein
MNQPLNKMPSNNPIKPPKESEERRSDTVTRKAIDEIQNLLFDPDAAKDIFALLLKCIVQVTSSELAVCYVSDEDAELPILPNTKLDAIYLNDTASFIHQEVLSSWVGEKNLLSRIIYYNHPIPKCVKALLAEDANISSLLILPVYLHSHLRAICVLANKDKKYDSAMLLKLKAIVGAVICTLQSAETVRGNFSGLDKKIADNRYLSSLISSSPIAVIVVNADGTILLSNPSAQDIFHPESIDEEASIPISLCGHNIHIFFPNYEEFFQWSKQEDKMGIEGNTQRPRLKENVIAYRKNGQMCTVNLTLFRYTHGAQRFTTLQIQDVTFVRASEEEYKRTSQQLNALNLLAPVAIIHISIDWDCTFSNDKWTEFSGLLYEDTVKHGWINAIHPDDVGDLLLSLRNNLQAGIDYYQEVRLLSPSGSTKWIDFSVRVLFDDEGTIDGFIATCHDVTERYINQEKLRHIAQYDSLTGLANRMLFSDRLQQSFNDSQRNNSLISVFFLDLDGFKDINDNLGHDVGDKLLQEVANRLINTLRKNDTVARFGGDEFVVMLGQEEHLPEVVIVANKLIEAIAKVFLIDGHDIFVTTSLGIAQGNTTNSNSNSNSNTILKNADIALYRAKKEGRNKYQLFSERLESDITTRINLVNDLRTGLVRDRFFLCFQPITSTKSNTILGFEALLRFKDKNDKVVSPYTFIPLLEENNMIIAVGQWVISETCKQIQLWQQQPNYPEGGYITFNLSARQMLDTQLITHIKMQCKEHQVDPKYLVMEITESVIINKTAKVTDALNQICALGMRLALDDFGTGYSSLSYLQKFPFHILKIDKSFIDNLDVHESNTKIVKAIIALANSFGLTVIAEGVETQAVKQAVSHLGADAYQGYYMSKPLPKEHFISFITTH